MINFLLSLHSHEAFWKLSQTIHSALIDLVEGRVISNTAKDQDGFFIGGVIQRASNHTCEQNLAGTNPEGHELPCVV